MYLRHKVHVFYLPKKGNPGDAEFHCPLIMADFPQCLSSRVPPPHSAPPLSLALYNNGISWYRLQVPPCTLLRVLFHQSCTSTINTFISHISDVFDIHTIYSDLPYYIFVLQYMYQYMYLKFIPLYDGFPEPSLGGSMGVDEI